MTTLMEIAQRAEALKSRVLELYDETIPKHRSYAEIARLAGTSKGNVYFIVKGRKTRAKG